MAPIPKTISGIQIASPGGVEVLQWKTDLPVPEPKEGEVLIKNEYLGVNYIDTYFRTGLYPAPMPLITGQEGAGTIVAVHPSVTDFSPGDRVAYLTRGAYAEYAVAPAIRTALLPSSISTLTAAASLLQGLTALTLIREAAQLGPRLNVHEQPWVLVHAAAGGTGTNLVQMLHALGAKVIGTAGSQEKCEMARRSGAMRVVNSREEDVVERVKEITLGRGPDVIFDGVGRDTFEMDLEMIARKGTLVSFGNASGVVPPVNLLRLADKNIRLMRTKVFGYLETKEEFEQYTRELFDLIAAEKVNVKVHEVYPLKEVARAHTDLEGRKTTGKLVLKL